MFDLLYALIRRFEGFRSRPYICPAGVPTIGYGSTRLADGSKVSMADAPMAEPAADALMQRDADQFARAVAAISPTLWLNHPAHQAIADFAYNLGTTRYKASTLRRRIDAGDMQGAADELAKWVWGGGRKLPGLIARRSAEADMLKKAA